MKQIIGTFLYPKNLKFIWFYKIKLGLGLPVNHKRIKKLNSLTVDLINISDRPNNKSSD